MFPYMLAAQGAIGLGRALFGNKKKNYIPEMPGFNFTPDPNDPEIGLRRRNALLDIQRGRSNTINEIGRAGLLGSSASFGLLNENQTRGEASLEDIPNSVYAKQRQDALTLYRDDANFRRSLALGDQGYDNQERMAGLESLGDLGSEIGYAFDQNSIERNSEAARRKRALDAIDWDF